MTPRPPFIDANDRAGINGAPVYELPPGHSAAVQAIAAYALEQDAPCRLAPDGRHDVDPVYTARWNVAAAICLRCGADLPLPHRGARPSLERARAA